MQPNTDQKLAQERFDYVKARRQIQGLDAKGKLVERAIRITGSEASMLLALVDHMPNIQPSIKRLAHMTCLDRKTVSTVLGQLEGKGLVRIVRHNHKRSSYYLADLACLIRGADTRKRRSVRVVTPHGSGSDTTNIRGKSGLKERNSRRKVREEGAHSLHLPLPDDWHPKASHATICDQYGLVLSIKAARYISYHRAHGSLRVDWDEDFNAWLMRDHDLTLPPNEREYCPL